MPGDEAIEIALAGGAKREGIGLRERVDEGEVIDGGERGEAEARVVRGVDVRVEDRRRVAEILGLADHGADQRGRVPLPRSLSLVKTAPMPSTRASRPPARKRRL